MISLTDLICPSCRERGGLVVLHRGRRLLLAECRNDTDGGFTCGHPLLAHGANPYGSDGIEVERVVFPPTMSQSADPAIPEPLAFSLAEARLCHDAGAHTAATVMVRRVLEAMCANQGISDKTSKGAPRGLKSKLEELRDKTDFIPGRLFNWAMHLKNVGDEGAHDVTSSATSRDAADAIELAEHMLDHLYVQTARYDRHVRERERRKLPAVDVEWSFESDNWDGGTWTLKADYPQRDPFQPLNTVMTISAPPVAACRVQGAAFFDGFRQTITDELFNVGHRIGKLARDPDDKQPVPWVEAGELPSFNDDPPF